MKYLEMYGYVYMYYGIPEMIKKLLFNQDDM